MAQQIHYLGKGFVGRRDAALGASFEPKAKLRTCSHSTPHGRSPPLRERAPHCIRSSCDSTSPRDARAESVGFASQGRGRTPPTPLLRGCERHRHVAIFWPPHRISFQSRLSVRGPCAFALSRVSRAPQMSTSP
jgi:hypothetical protein